VGLPNDVALNDNKKRIEEPVSELDSDSLPINDIGLETIVEFASEIENAKTGYRTNAAIRFEEGELVSFFLLFQDSRRKIDGFDFGTELTPD